MIQNQSREILTEPTFEGELPKTEFLYIQNKFYKRNLNFIPEIDHTTLCMVLGEPVINADELSLFEAMVRWGIKECERRGIDINSPERQRQCLGEALFLIRYVCLI